MKELSINNTAFSWIEERTILLAPTGSKAYGTDIESSDTDYKGICVPPLSFYLGMESFNEYNNTGGKNFKNTKEDVDVSIIHINKFIKDAMQCVPNNIELLFMEEDKYLKMTGIGKELIENRHIFLSKQVYKKFGGFALSQMKKMQAKAGRLEYINAFGYDVKFFMHSIRLLTSAIEILETGDFSTFRPNRELLLECRTGRYTFEEAIEMVEKYDKQLKEAYQSSTLQEHADYDKINQLLVSLNKKALGLSCSKKGEF